jgi:peptidoglycan/LPS O-acetylase OafA/YrhL
LEAPDIVETQDASRDSVCREQIPWLDGCRGIAALMVVLVHAGLYDFLGHPGFEVSTTGVSIFFALSGFLITRILLYNKRQQISVMSFWLRRASRIFPVAYVYLVVVAVVWPSRIGPNRT